MRALLPLLVSFAAASAQTVPSPRDHFGFDPGEDRRLLRWEELCGYYRAVAAASGRVRYEVLGRTTEGRDLVMLVVSSLPDGRLESVRALQGRLAYGELSEQELERARAVQPAVVYVQATLHSTEIGASCMVPHLVHGLATGSDPDTTAVLENVVVLIVPSANPDGQDLVVDWYRRTLETPWEGTSPPRLYHRYAGHDDNRDWFMLSLRETRLVSDVLYRRWFPEVVLDIHQMGGRGARMFVPPYADPLNPNVPSMVSRMTDLVGTHMALALTRAGKTGVMQDVRFDNWWHGGARSVPARHNMIGILTETAGARLATPVFLSPDELRGHGRGLPTYQRRGNLPDPWPGGWWRLRDVVAYQRISTEAVLRFAARHRAMLVDGFHAEAGRQIRLGREEPPYGWEIPADQLNLGGVARLVDNLVRTGVRVHAVRKETEGSPRVRYVVPAAQAFRPHLKDLLEPQRYPVLRTEPGGRVIRPYDAAGWTLPFQFGVRCHPLSGPPDAEALGRPLEAAPRGVFFNDRPGKASTWIIAAGGNDAYTFVNRVLDRGVQVYRDASDPRRPFVLKGAPSALPDFESAVRGLSLAFRQTDVEEAERLDLSRVRRGRVGLLIPHPPSMDAGWTRLVLEEHGFEPRLLSFADVRSGDLLDDVDTLVLADVSARTLREGPRPGRLPPEYQGGLGVVGARELRSFVRGGGQILAFARAVQYVADVFGRDVRYARPPGVEAGDIVVPGSILRARVVRGHQICAGVSDDVAVYTDRDRVLLAGQPEEPAALRPVLAFARSDLLLSGHLTGAEHLAGHGILGVAAEGGGRLVLYGFRPQHRSQTLGTFPLIFNALYRPAPR